MTMQVIYSSLRTKGFFSKTLLEAGRSFDFTKKLACLPRCYQCCYYATKEVFKRDKPHCNVGTIGHHHHGKTSLTAAITKVLSERNLATLKTCEELDNSPHEKAKGMGMNVSFVEYSTKNRHYIHADCPGHVDYVKNMVTSLSQMNGNILVVACTEGILPQTREHLLLSKHFGIENLVVFINKADAENNEKLELVELECRKLLTELGYNGKNIPVVCGSALEALKGKQDEMGTKSIDRLLEAVDNYIPTPVWDLDKPALMPIQSMFQIQGKGLIVSGQLERGKLNIGDEVELIGHGQKLTSVITEMEMFYKNLEEAQAGDKCFLQLRGIKKDQINRGMFLTKPNTLSIHDHLEAKIHFIPKEDGEERPVSSYMKFEIYSRGWDCAAVLMLPHEEMSMPSKNTGFILKLFKEMPVEEGQRFSIRQSKKTIGSGIVSCIRENMTPDEISELSLSKKQREKRKGNV